MAETGIHTHWNDSGWGKTGYTHVHPGGELPHEHRWNWKADQLVKDFELLQLATEETGDAGPERLTGRPAPSSVPALDGDGSSSAAPPGWCPIPPPPGWVPQNRGHEHVWVEGSHDQMPYCRICNAEPANPAFRIPTKDCACGGGMLGHIGYEHTVERCGPPGNLDKAPRPSVVTCPGCEGMSTLKGQPDCEMCGNHGNLPIADFDNWLLVTTDRSGTDE